MIRYYAYYSVGGYKDLYLGNSEEKNEASYYLPLMGIWERKADTNPEYAKRLEECRDLPKIQVATVDDMLGLPSKAAEYFVHGGYKELLSTLSDGNFVLIFRDIESKQKDDSGRNIPFLFCFVADDPADADKLARIAAYGASKNKEMNQILSNSLVYDAQHNGLRFDLKGMNEWFAKTASSYPAEIAYSKGIKKLDIQGAGVHFISVPNGLTAEYVFGEIGEPLVKDAVFEVNGCYDASNEKMRERAVQEARANRKMKLLKQIGIVGLGVASLSALVTLYLTHRQ